MSSRTGGGGSGGTVDYGSVYGKKITAQEYLDMRNEFRLFYLFHYGTLPEKANVSETEMQRETYIRLLLIAKAQDLGIYVGLDAAASAASQMLRVLGREGQTVTPEIFADQVLKPAQPGLTMADFQNFARHDVVIQQLVQALGQPGELVTPQEATAAYVRERQEISAQMVYFSASNFLSSVSVTPAGLGTFYTNYLAAYRVPDRVQLNYVMFDVASYLAQSKAELAKTNLDTQVNEIYLQYGDKAVPDAKTPEEAKAKIREQMILNRALLAARAVANDFAAGVFKVEPARAENLTAAAKKAGLTVQTTAPFAADAIPPEFAMPENFRKVVASLTPDEPFANPIVTTNGVYVIALARQIPSEIPPFDQIRARVMHDYQMQQAATLARDAGTNFGFKLMVSLAAGKSFADTCASSKLPPEILPPFSLSTRDLPALDGRVDLNLLKQMAFTTPDGHATGFEATADGGFILFVQARPPIDLTAERTDLPQFTTALRRAREQEVFNEWLNAEANRELRTLPFARQAMAQ